MTSPIAPWFHCRKAGIAEARPYVEGEDMALVSVSEGTTPIVGGYVFRDRRDPTDLWYVGPAFYDANYELV